MLRKVEFPPIDPAGDISKSWNGHGDDNAFAAAFAAALASNSSLEKLSVSGWQVPPSGYEHVMKALAAKSELTSVNWSGCLLAETGGVALAAALEGNSSFLSRDM